MINSKRLFDITLCILLLPIVVPLLACLCLWIRLDSRGSALFKQARVGQGLVPFSVYKLRTMVVRKDTGSEPLLSSADDSRVTRAGRTLRTLSVDELPQIWNVLRGEMSLVGPRPIVPEQLKAIAPDQMVRFEVRPGITGLAQVSGRRSLSWPDQLAFDCFYARHATLGLDLKILLSTIVTVLGRRGVYGDMSGNWRNYIDKH